jgi:hypothetical protein
MRGLKMIIRPDIKFYSYEALQKEKDKINEEFICSTLAWNQLSNDDRLMLDEYARPYQSAHVGDIIETYFQYDKDIVNNWDVYTAVEYDMAEEPDEVIFVGTKREVKLASKYFGDGMLITV